MVFFGFGERVRREREYGDGKSVLRDMKCRWMV
jgi:hypothetical protein